MENSVLPAHGDPAIKKDIGFFDGLKLFSLANLSIKTFLFFFIKLIASSDGLI
jgi:hypothetical protein